MYYKKVLIKSEEDLPAKGNFYIVHFKGRSNWQVSTVDFHPNNYYKSDGTYKEHLNNKFEWLMNFDWYLQPIDNPEIDLREELIKFAQQFYADEETCKSNIDEYLKSQK